MTWGCFTSGTISTVVPPADTSTLYFTPPHRCCIAIIRRTGNQHVQHQHGRCCCGKTYRRTIHWGRRNESEWSAIDE